MTVSMSGLSAAVRQHLFSFRHVKGSGGPGTGLVTCGSSFMTLPSLSQVQPTVMLLELNSFKGPKRWQLFLVGHFCSVLHT